MRIVCISDTHTMGKLLTIPEGDVLIHAGDHTFRGTKEETKQALKWLTSLKEQFKHIVFVAGNHDFYFDDKAPTKFRDWRIYKPYTKWEMLERHGPGLIYLEDSSVEIEGLKFYGSPWQPWFHGWAFNFPAPGKEMRFNGGLVQSPEDIEYSKMVAIKTWAKIPDDVDVLVTHSPPKGIMDKAWYDRDDDRVGCPALRERLLELKNLRLHVFGHIHENYGTVEYGTDLHGGYKWSKITFVNAAVNTRMYEPTNAPIVIEI